MYGQACAQTEIDTHPHTVREGCREGEREEKRGEKREAAATEKVERGEKGNSEREKKRERGRQTEGAQGKEEHFGRCAGEGRSTEIMQKEKMHANRFLVNSGREG